jgi:hypothetical protein
MSDILIELRVFDPMHNRRRARRVVAGPDLFGLWTAHVGFRRIGGADRAIRREFTTEAAAVRFVRRGLRRRATAVRRLGVPYRPVEASPAADHLLAVTGIRSPEVFAPRHIAPGAPSWQSEPHLERRGPTNFKPAPETAKWQDITVLLLSGSSACPCRTFIIGPGH